MTKFNISVVIPNFNSEKTIERCLESIVKQTLLPTEVLIIDDASTDASLEIIERFVTKSSSLIKIHILINDVNCGPSTSRNRGIDKSSGDWIAFLDSDDYWAPRKLELQCQAIQQYNSFFVGTSVKKNKFSDKLKPKILTPESFLWKNYFATPTVLVKKNHLLKFDDSKRYAEDYDLWLKLMDHYKSAVLIPIPLVTLGKPPYLYSGLSSQLWNMEIAEIKVLLKRENTILKTLAIIFSIIKFFVRLIRTTYYRLLGQNNEF